MHDLPPLPFRLRVPDEDVIDAKGVRSVSYKLEGRAYLTGESLTFEFAGTRTTDQVTLSRIGTDVSRSPLGTAEIPLEAIADAEVRGGWWWPQIVFRGRGLGAFDEVPGARPGALVLKIRRVDRPAARAFADVVNQAARQALLSESHQPDALEAPGERSTPV